MIILSDNIEIFSVVKLQNVVKDRRCHGIYLGNVT